MAKTAIFHGILTYIFLTFFKDCDHIYVPNGPIWGSTERPYIGDVVMSLFLLWGRPFMTGDGPKRVHFGPKMDQNGQSKCFWPFGAPFGPIWTLLDHFRQKRSFAPNGQSRVLQRCFRAKYQFRFEMAQKCPKWSKPLRLTIWVR